MRGSGNLAAAVKPCLFRRAWLATTCVIDDSIAVIIRAVTSLRAWLVLVARYHQRSPDVCAFPVKPRPFRPLDRGIQAGSVARCTLPPQLIAPTKISQTVAGYVDQTKTGVVSPAH